MREKPNIVNAILLSFFAFFIFFIVHILCSIIVAFIILMISKIPLIGTLVEWLFRARGDTPGMFTILLSAFISYAVTTEVLERLNSNVKTEALSLILTGSYVLLIQAISFLINLVNGDPFFINIVLIISSISLIFRGKERMK